MFSALMTLTTPNYTGASRVAFEYAKAVIRQGGSVMLAHGREPDVDDGRDSLLKKMRDAGIKLKSEPRLELPWESSLVRDLTKVAEEESIDCVIGNNQRDRSVAINVANRASLPAIVCGHNQHVFRGRWPLPMIKKRYYRNAVRRANLVICSSKQVENEFVDWFDVDKERCVLMPHGIQPTNEQAFSQEQIEQLRSSFTAGPSDLLLCNVGRIDPQKGQDTLLQALKLLPTDLSYRLVLVGAVSADSNEAQNLRYETELKRLAKELPDPSRVFFAGWRDDFELIMSASDAYVHSARWEGLPLTVLAAMSARRPVIAPDNSSRPPGFEDNVHGLLVQPNDPKSLAASIQKIASSRDSNKLSRMTQQARLLIEERYDMNRISDRFANVVHNTIQNYRANRTSTTDVQKGSTS